MSFQQALSGLNASSQAIDVTSNNIANSSTVGFKSANADFSDVYAAAMNGSGASQVGIGVDVSAVQQQFTQGTITTTNNPLDVAINGSGFFQMSTNGALTYTRNGQFHLDKSGYIINDQSMQLTGYPAQNGVIVQSTPQPLQISASDLAPAGTGLNTTSSFNGIKAGVNLNSTSTTPTSSWVDGAAAGNTTAYSPDPQTYNWSTATSIYDTLGNQHNMTFYFAKSATSAGTWDVYANVDGTTNANVTSAAGIVGEPGTPIGQLKFNANGTLISGSPMSVTVNMLGVEQSLGQPNGNGAQAAQTFPIDFTGTTQYGSAFGVSNMLQDGYAAGHLTGLSVGSDGVIQGQYSNGLTLNQGQIVLANFKNPNGLQSQGNNQWSQTSVSGQPLVGAPNTSNLGVLSSGSVEDSNVDLTAQLVNLITDQRNYQANAQSIKTQDQIMQTLVNLQ